MRLGSAASKPPTQTVKEEQVNIVGLQGFEPGVDHFDPFVGCLRVILGDDEHVFAPAGLGQPFADSLLAIAPLIAIRCVEIAHAFGPGCIHQTRVRVAGSAEVQNRNAHVRLAQLAHGQCASCGLFFGERGDGGQACRGRCGGGQRRSGLHEFAARYFTHVIVHTKSLLGCAANRILFRPDSICSTLPAHKL